MNEGGVSRFQRVFGGLRAPSSGRLSNYTAQQYIPAAEHGLFLHMLCCRKDVSLEQDVLRATARPTDVTAAIVTNMWISGAS